MAGGLINPQQGAILLPIASGGDHACRGHAQAGAGLRQFAAGEPISGRCQRRLLQFPNAPGQGRGDIPLLRQAVGITVMVFARAVHRGIRLFDPAQFPLIALLA